MHAAALRMRGQQCRHCGTSSSRSTRPAAVAFRACRSPAARTARPVAARATFSATDGDVADVAASPVAAQALQELFDLERSGSMDQHNLADFRLKYGIRRGLDGRVQLRRQDGSWMAIKLDMEIKGTMLLRDINDSSVHVLMTEQLEQIDLSDDYLLLTLFADGMWEGQTKPIELGDGQAVEPLRLDEQAFKDFVGLIKTLQELEDAEGADQAAQGGGSSSGSRLSSISDRMDGPEIDVQAEPVNGR